MPIRGARLRWPPRPGKRSDAAAPNGRRAMSGSEPVPSVKQQLQGPKSDREDPLNENPSSPRESIQKKGQ